MTVALAAVLAPAGLTATASACPHADERPAKLTRAEARTAILCLVNKRRDKLGRRDLNGDPRLRRAAQRHARSMNKRNYFSHTSPSGATPYDRVSRTGYFSGASSWGVGEVIYSGARRSGTPRRAVRGWMRSGPHRDALMGTFRDIGIGVAFGSPWRDGRARNTAIYTVDLGYRR